jgi:hypothetical protein
MKVADLAVGGAESEIPKTSPLMADFELKSRRLMDELATVESRMTGGPALRERLQALEAEALIGKPVDRELEKARAAARELADAEQKASILHRALRTLEKERLEAERTARAELAPIAIAVYANAVREHARNLLAARVSALRLYGLRRQMEERFSSPNPTGVHLPGYAATPILALASTWHRLLAAQYSELKGWLRDAYDLGLLGRDDLGGVYEPKPEAPPLTGTVVMKRAWSIVGALAHRKGEDVPKPQVRSDSSGDLFELDGWTEVWTSTGRIPVTDLRDGDRVEFRVSSTAAGARRLSHVTRVAA